MTRLRVWAKPFILGTLVAVALLVACQVIISIFADSRDMSSFHLGLGSLTIYDVQRSANGSSVTTSGPGVLVIGIAIGMLNGFGALFLHRERDDRE